APDFLCPNAQRRTPNADGAVLHRGHPPLQRSQALLVGPEVVELLLQPKLLAKVDEQALVPLLGCQVLANGREVEDSDTRALLPLPVTVAPKESEPQQPSEPVRQDHRVERQVAGEGGRGGEARDGGRFASTAAGQARCGGAEMGRAEWAVVDAAEQGSRQPR